MQYDAGMIEERRQRVPNWLRDLGLFALINIMVFTNRAEVETIFLEEMDPQLNPASPFVIGLTVVMAATTFGRRKYPRMMFGIGVAIWMWARGLGTVDTGEILIIAVLAHSVGMYSPREHSLKVGLAGAGLLVAWTGMGMFLSDAVTLDTILGVFVAVTIPLALGREVYRRARRLQSAHDRAEQAERNQATTAAEAVEEEQGRIARELHDVVAHQMAVMTIQAEGAARLARDGDPRISEALKVIEDAGRDGLTEMRRMVGLLRHDDGPADLTPQPGIERIQSLADQMTSAGLPVKLRNEGDSLHLPPGTSLNIYRIVSEALTNALKHGGTGATAEVLMSYQPHQVRVEITDTGHGSAASLDALPGGHGLVGMQERVNLLSGELEAGPVDGGGFKVSALIPVTQ